VEVAKTLILFCIQKESHHKILGVLIALQNLENITYTDVTVSAIFNGVQSFVILTLS
jgi:hypothetical protein